MSTLDEMRDALLRDLCPDKTPCIGHRIFVEQYEAAAQQEARAGLVAALDGAYTERNRMVAALIKVGGYPAVTFEDQSEPGWWVVYANTPAGQVSWHVGIRDIGLFLDIPSVIDSPWDGHDTDEKYRRVAALATSPAPEVER